MSGLLGHTLEEISGTLSHTSVDVGLKSQLNEPENGRRVTHFRCLDVIMEVVAEGLDVGDTIIAALRCQVSREED